MPTVDNLDIEISASVSKANSSLDLLVKRLGKVSASLSGVNSRGLATMGSGVNKLANAMNNFSNNTNTAVFTRLTKNLNSIGNINPIAITNASKSLGKIAGAMQVLNNVNITENAHKLGDLAKGISQLGYKSSTQAIQNIPKLANAMRELMQTLSTAPRISQNLIDMTNALAKLARTGSSSGKAVTSLGNSFDFFSKSAKTAKTRSFSLAGAIGKLYATYWLLFRAFSKIGESIDIASSLQEVENVINKTFGDYRNLINEFASTSLENFGLTELDAKQIAGRFQAMGMAMGFAQGKMAEMSMSLTALAGDMASFYNVEQADVAKSLQSVFTGETEPLRKYGLDLTQATLKEWTLTQGLNANISAMSQSEKTMLRYQYVMANTEMIQGDFADTIDTWHNQLVLAKGSLQELMRVVGNIGINFLKPLVSAFNTAMQAIIQFAVEVQNALGKIFGWTVKYTPGGMASDFEDTAESAGDIADGTGEAAKNAKKLRQQLQGIDELNVLTSNKGSYGGGGGSDGSDNEIDVTVGTWSIEETEALYESEIDTLYKLGEYIGQTLTRAMNDIDWNSVYQSAKDFGKGLADFLNGLISPELFGATGRTIAGALNTALYFLSDFGKTFDWTGFGESIAEGINEFFKTFDFKELASGLNAWVNGIVDAIKGFIKTIEWEDAIVGLTEFLTELDIGTIGLAISAIAWKYGGKEYALNGLSSLLQGEVNTGIGDIKISKTASLAIMVSVAIAGFKLGNWLYENVEGVQNWADPIGEALGSLFVGEWNLNDIVGAGMQFNIDIQTKLMNLVLPDGMEVDANTVAKGWLPKYLWDFVFGDEYEKKNAIQFGVNIISTVDNIKQKLADAFKKAKEWWIEHKLLSVSIAIPAIKTLLKDKFNLAKVWWKDNKKLSNISIGVDSIITTVKTAWDKFKTWWDKVNFIKIEFDANTFARTLAGFINSHIILPINEKVLIPLRNIPLIGDKVKILDYVSYETGGFPEDGWFRANHGEVMGRFDNGKSVVANNRQITDGIANAVYRGNREMVAVMQQELSETRRQNDILMGILQKETGISYKDVFNATQRGANEYKAMTGRPAFT